MPVVVDLAAEPPSLSEPSVWAGEAVDLITDRPPAAALVETLAAQAQDALHRWS